MKTTSKYANSKKERHIPVFVYCNANKHKLFEVKPIKYCYQCKKGL